MLYKMRACRGLQPVTCIRILQIASTSALCLLDAQEKKAAMINASFCGDALNGGGIGARYPLETVSSWDSNSVNGTSLIVTVQNNSTVAIVGTADGRILKVIICAIHLQKCFLPIGVPIAVSDIGVVGLNFAD